MDGLDEGGFDNRVGLGFEDSPRRYYTTTKVAPHIHRRRKACDMLDGRFSATRVDIDTLDPYEVSRYDDADSRRLLCVGINRVGEYGGGFVAAVDPKSERARFRPRRRNV